MLYKAINFAHHKLSKFGVCVDEPFGLMFDSTFMDPRTTRPTVHNQIMLPIVEYLRESLVLIIARRGVVFASCYVIIVF